VGGREGGGGCGWEEGTAVGRGVGRLQGYGHGYDRLWREAAPSTATEIFGA